jgi:hypothetical protein
MSGRILFPPASKQNIPLRSTIIFIDKDDFTLKFYNPRALHHAIHGDIFSPVAPASLSIPAIAAAAVAAASTNDDAASTNDDAPSKSKSRQKKKPAEVTSALLYSLERKGPDFAQAKESYQTEENCRSPEV